MAECSSKNMTKVVAATIAAATIGTLVPGVADAATDGGQTSAASRVTAELGRLPGLLPATGAVADNSASTSGDVAFASSAAPSTRVTPNLTVTPNAYPHTDAATIGGANDAAHVFVLRDSSANPNVNFTVSGGKLVKDILGGVEVLDSKGIAQTRISSPWAYDATGKALPTTYTIAGNILTQHVDTHNAVFPVVADPRYTWVRISGTVYFNKNETNVIANHVNWVSIIAGNAPGV